MSSRVIDVTHYINKRALEQANWSCIQFLPVSTRLSCSCFLSLCPDKVRSYSCLKFLTKKNNFPLKAPPISTFLQCAHGFNFSLHCWTFNKSVINHRDNLFQTDQLHHSQQKHNNSHYPRWVSSGYDVTNWDTFGALTWDVWHLFFSPMYLESFSM